MSSLGLTKYLSLATFTKKTSSPALTCTQRKTELSGSRHALNQDFSFSPIESKPHFSDLST